jgi:hypothetical protein
MAFGKWHYPKCFQQMFARLTFLNMKGNERVHGERVNLVIGCCTYNMVLMTTSQWKGETTVRKSRSVNLA